VRDHKLLVVLLVSIAFNVGFASQVALDWSKSRIKAATSHDLDCYPKEFHHLCSQLQTELDARRSEQAVQTRQLAQLMTSNEPDMQAISLCLDQLSATERSIKGLVIDTVLEQRATLAPAERESFCSYVQNRLCAPWADCRPNGGCAPHDEQPDCSDQKPESNANGRQP